MKRSTGRDLEPFGIEVWADVADVGWVRRHGAASHVTGFTTNPTLARAAGVSDYTTFSRDFLAAADGKPVCIEVLADEIGAISRQARQIASWGPQVWVKVPVTTTARDSTASLIGVLCSEGVRVNVTAVMTPAQVEALLDQIPSHSNMIVSMFAGRIADTGRDPIPVVSQCCRLLAGHPNARLLWASAREVLNLRHAIAAGCDAITLTPALLGKLELFGKDLAEFSLETVAMFHRDAVAAGFCLSSPESESASLARSAWTP